MIPDVSTFSRCGRHPSQIFTGFCSSCLVERLSSVDSVDRSLKPPIGRRSEIVEVSEPDVVPGDSERKRGGVRVRKTLLSLFELDDRNDAEMESVGILENGCDDLRNQSDEAQVGEKFDLGTGVLQSRVRPESRFSTSSSALEDVSSDGNIDRKGEKLEEKSGSSWLKGLRWKSRGSFRQNQMQERCLNGESKEEKLESVHDFRHSCEWRVSRDPSKATWEKPRHSWDGSLMSKALACPFACLEEPQDGCCRVRRRLSEEPTVTSAHGSSETFNVGRTSTASLANERYLYRNGSVGRAYGERQHEECQRELDVLNVRRKKSCRWSKVWDWSITSPFRDFGKKREGVLERSLSESWQESRKDNNTATVEVDSGVRSYVNGLSTARTNQWLNRSINGATGDLPNFRPEWWNKKDCRLGRSRSVHYSSPGNIDSGLLRFYLTPLRTSRRSTNKGRMRSSHSLARGILGL